MGVGTILARRAVMLTAALIIVVFLTAIILGATGYDKQIWESIINGRARAYRQALSQRPSPPSDIGKLSGDIRLALRQISASTDNLYKQASSGNITKAAILQYVDKTRGPVNDINKKAMEMKKLIEKLSATSSEEISFKNKELFHSKRIISLSETIGKQLDALEEKAKTNNLEGADLLLKSIKSELGDIGDSTLAINQVEINRAVKSFETTLEHIYKLDKPWYDRVLPLAYSTLFFNLGETTSRDIAAVAGEPAPIRVSRAIYVCLPRTIVMITVAQVIAAAVALVVGPLIAYRRGSLLDRGILTYAALTNAIPVWWLAMVFIYFFGYHYKVFPTDYRGIIAVLNNFWADPMASIKEILYYSSLPVITIVIAFIGSWLYSVRAMVLRVVREDFVTVARAKGLPENVILSKHILRTAAPPVITSVILALAGSLGGYIITESVFDWPGMGTLYFAAITSGDVPTILGLTYVLTLVYVLARFFLEVLYIILDPRVRY